jgi:hypothetical protein
MTKRIGLKPQSKKLFIEIHPTYVLHLLFLNSTRKETFVSHLNVATMQRVLFESRTCHEFATLTEGIYKAHYGNQDFFPLANGVYFITKSPLRNGKNPLRIPLTKMGIAHTFCTLFSCLIFPMLLPT